MFAQQGIGDFFRIGVHLVEWNVVRYRIKGSKIRARSKTVGHRCSGSVELVHRRQTQHQLHRAQQAGLIVLGAYHGPATGVRAGDIRGGAIAADVVPGLPGETVLRARAGTKIVRAVMPAVLDARQPRAENPSPVKDLLSAGASNRNDAENLRPSRTASVLR